MHELAEAIGNLSTKIALGRVSGQDVSKLEEQQKIHERNLTALARKPVRAPETREIETGETWVARWPRLDWNGRNDLLREKGIKLSAGRRANGDVYVVAEDDIFGLKSLTVFGSLARQGSNPLQGRGLVHEHVARLHGGDSKRCHLAGLLGWMLSLVTVSGRLGHPG